MFALAVATHAQVLRISPAVVGNAQPGPQQVIQLIGGGASGSNSFRSQASSIRPQASAFRSQASSARSQASSIRSQGSSLRSLGASRAINAGGISSSGLGGVQLRSIQAGGLAGLGGLQQGAQGLNLVGGEPTVLLITDGLQGFGGAQLGGAQLSGAQFSGAQLSGAQLSGASLQSASRSSLVANAGASRSSLGAVAPRAPAAFRAAPRASAASRGLGEDSEPTGTPEPFAFSFETEDEQGNKASRQESSDTSGTVTGSYTITDVLTGATRTVNYVADADGFHAQVDTNEPGTLTSEPADVQVRSSAPAQPSRR